MAFSDVLETFRVVDDEQAEAGSEGSEKRVCLPKPDVNNITVLTENLPNEPILPWHHFDSPWLEKDELTPDEAHSEPEPSAVAENYSVRQLTLALDEVELAVELPQSVQPSHRQDAEDSLPESP